MLSKYSFFICTIIAQIAQLVFETLDAMTSRDLKTLTELGVFRISELKGSGVFYEFD